MRLAFVALFPVALLACEDDAALTGGGGAGGAAGGAGGAGASGGAGLGPDRFLEPSEYDCSAGEVSPASRPHELACVYDPACESRFVVAHRMGNPFGPENSLSVLRASILLGADVVETDVRMTADGHVVLIHDAEVDRTLEGTGDVEALTLAELRAMPVKTEFGDPDGDFSCERVITLDEVFAVSAGKILVELETKRVDAGIASAEYLRDNELYDAGFVQCSADECAAIRAVVPDVPIMLRVESLTDLDFGESLDPPPILYEIDGNSEWTTPEVTGRIHAGGAKVFANAFFDADVRAFLGDLSGYGELYDTGVDLAQSEYPHLALVALGRLEPDAP
jgi:glycerophosphoryl diester phosphodiesterase